MEPEKLETPEITNKDLLRREIMLLWLEENMERKEEDWERECRIEFDIAFDLLTEDPSRDIGKELMENPIRILNELKAELAILKQIENILVHNEHVEDNNINMWRLQHRRDVKEVFHQMRKHDPAFLEKFKNDPSALEQEMKDLHLAA